MHNRYITTVKAGKRTFAGSNTLSLLDDGNYAINLQSLRKDEIIFY